ncbi:NYN domain-containing protein [Shewanella sp. 3_MG-2023]|uniref:NYN domain-containing protein n=1 Tax=Shewanella sp. 3_MG-2023 TaxID=3062635 RepID=UPI0026E3C494|nr:NYN domain-containing protein [Shewanella sp. 3_MG-2023]MDO6777370.1 NYN domain-containing protein [Shewanella sp. 3_MG-2023]
MMDLTFAVLVDGENASQAQYASMLEEVEKYGTVAIKWVYADWTSRQQSGWQDVLHETASSPKQQFHYGKDAADHALVMDAIELISNNQRINAICIVSSDGGFYSLAQRVREKGLHVMAIGKENTPERFRKACHNFVLTKNLSEPATRLSHQDLNVLLVDSYLRCAESNEPVYLGDMGKMLKTFDSSFDHRNYGFLSLKKLIKDKIDLFEIVDERSDRCFIAMRSNLVAQAGAILKGVIRKLDFNREFGFITSNSGDFHFSFSGVRAEVVQLREGLTVWFKVPSLESHSELVDGQCPTVKHVALKKALVNAA